MHHPVEFGAECIEYKVLLCDFLFGESLFL